MKDFTPGEVVFTLVLLFVVVLFLYVTIPMGMVVFDWATEEWKDLMMRWFA